jgi:hypothetical protein
MRQTRTRINENGRLIVERILGTVGPCAVKIPVAQHDHLRRGCPDASSSRTGPGILPATDEYAKTWAVDRA